jgi:DNA repair protein SbcD/Mre11
VRFVHAADIHLDSPLRGLSRYEGAPVAKMRLATRDALENLVGLCIEEQARLLLIAGDLYDGSWRDYGTGLFFTVQMARLRQAGVRVVLVRGNHDAESRITKALRLPDNVTELGSKRPETVVLEDLGIAVHGQSFATRAVTSDLASAYPEAVPGVLNVGLLHTCATGRAGHESYAPCSVETLRLKGYQYWALGHVHEREVLGEDPWIVFPGNLQGRHARETGPKGATLVTYEGAQVTSVEHRVLDSVRWAVCSVDVGDAAVLADVLELARTSLAEAVEAADGRPLAARVVLHGVSAAHAALEKDPEARDAQIRALGADAGGAGVWIEKIVLGTRMPIDLVEIAGRDDAIGHLARSLAGLRADDAALAELGGELADLAAKLPPELRTGEDAIRLDDPGFLRGALDGVEQVLFPRLLASETDP